jgi:integrase
VLRRGVPIAYVSRQLGHSSIQVTVDLYGHFVPGADRHHVEGLAEAIEAAGSEPNATLAQPLPAEVDPQRSK